MQRRPDVPTAITTADDEAEAWRLALREGAVTGSLAGILSTAVLAIAGARQNRSAVAPINAASHWIWGDESLREDRPTLRHTLLGYLTQHAASIFWAVLYSRLYGHRREAKQWPQALAGAATACAVAGAVDYLVVPKRLTPGYEHRLSIGAMVAVYAALAAGFALGSVAMRDR